MVTLRACETRLKANVFQDSVINMWLKRWCEGLLIGDEPGFQRCSDLQLEILGFLSADGIIEYINIFKEFRLERGNVTCFWWYWVTLSISTDKRDTWLLRSKLQHIYFGQERSRFIIFKRYWGMAFVFPTRPTTGLRKSTSIFWEYSSVNKKENTFNWKFPVRNFSSAVEKFWPYFKILSAYLRNSSFYFSTQTRPFFFSSLIY